MEEEEECEKPIAFSTEKKTRIQKHPANIHVFALDKLIESETLD